MYERRRSDEINVYHRKTTIERCCVWYVMCPRDWALVALGEVKAR